MPTTDVTNTLTATITSTEQSTSQVPINRSTGNPAFNSNVGEFVTYRQFGAGSNAIGIPSQPATQFYIKNIDAALSFVLQWALGGGALFNVLTLFPGDQIIFWQSPANAGAGITNLSLTMTANTLVEFFLGG